MCVCVCVCVYNTYKCLLTNELQAAGRMVPEQKNRNASLHLFPSADLEQESIEAEATSRPRTPVLNPVVKSSRIYIYIYIYTYIYIYIRGAPYGRLGGLPPKYSYRKTKIQNVWGGSSLNPKP